MDNILLEVQDVRNSSHLHVYEGAATLAELDPLLASRGFRRQYCEWNRWAKNVREINCLYANVAVAAGSKATEWLWATGNSLRARSMVSYGPEPPRHMDLVRRLKTSADAGARVQ